MRTVWWINQDYKESDFAKRFPNFTIACKADGEELANNKMNRVVKLNLNGKYYYLKHYFRAGRNLRKYIGTSRARREWRNLQRFRELSIPTPDIIAFGESRLPRKCKPGILVTKEVANTNDLANLVHNKDSRLHDKEWLLSIIKQVAKYTYTLHQHRFVHNDLKWRNILVTNTKIPAVYFIDCPAGRKAFWPFLQRGIIKDLACLDKVAKYQLSRTKRLRFYLEYRGIRRLGNNDKRIIRKILAFFAGRE